MPVDYSNYPPDWKEIRQRILDRDRHKCKWCQVPNYSMVRRGHSIHAGTYMLDGVIRCHKTGAPLPCFARVLPSEYRFQRTTKIVLTVAHLDHDITNNTDENLAALCQRCHLEHDREQHAENARRTRDLKRGQADMMEAVQ